MPRVNAGRAAGAGTAGFGEAGLCDGTALGEGDATGDGDGAAGDALDGDCPGLTAAISPGRPGLVNRPLNDAATPSEPNAIAAMTTVGINQGRLR
jgi:hypothetical protein